MTRTSIDINRPAEQVYAYVTDPSQFHQWQQDVVSGGLRDPGPVEVGSHCQMVRRIGGANRPSTSVVTKLDPPTNWAVRGIDGPIRARVDVDVQPLQRARSRVTIDVDFEGHGIGKVLVPLVVRRQAAKEMPENLQRLRDRLEAEPVHPS
jgi:uncharacterized protein YndB with AHSA1/START domain